MHQRGKFSGIISFDLVGSGGTAWRLGQDLRIPACGWAIGSDVRVPRGSSYERALLKALKHLDIVFYQSNELVERTAERLDTTPAKLEKDRHVVLPHGIPLPPRLPREELRKQIRAQWEVKKDDIVVLAIGRIVRSKGVFELLSAISFAARVDPRIRCVLIGSKPAFDESEVVKKELDRNPDLRKRVRLLPNCDSDRVWEVLCGADMFAFPSHKEGMPNSLLEAMVMGVASIAFAIPSVLEINNGEECIVTAPAFDPQALSEAILRLAAHPEERAALGERGMNRVMQKFTMPKQLAEVIRRLSEVARKNT